MYCTAALLCIYNIKLECLDPFSIAEKNCIFPLDPDIVSHLIMVAESEGCTMLTITEVSRTHDVSARMLRYYEQQGLIVSCRREGYAYRVYDEENIARLRLILVLRKLRVPLKSIAAILSTGKAEEAVRVLRERIAEIDEERRNLTTIREMLTVFVQRIGLSQNTAQRLALLGDEALLSAVNALGLSSTTLKEKTLMNDLQNTDNARWKTLNVRYVMLPETTVAAFHYFGPDPEDHVGAIAEAFVRESHLYTIKPDARMFGFNAPNPSPEREHYGYDIWITIPNDMDVPAPGVKKTMPGGLYAAHTIDFPNFHEWQWLLEWAENNTAYTLAHTGTSENMFGALEEYLNWVMCAQTGDQLPIRMDLLLPIRKRE